MYEYFEYRRHPLTRPAPERGADPQRHAVAVVGGGPAGLALALGLARYGVKVLLIEADDTVSFGSRATCISRRSFEVFERIGVSAALLAKCLPWTSGTSFYGDAAVFRLQMPHDATQKFAPMYNLQQCILEQFLVDGVEAQRDLIEVRWKTRLTALTPGDDGVELTLDTDDGPYTLKADWVVACDGARSVARHALGLRFSGTTYEGTYIIVDVHLKSGYPTERRAWFDPPSNPGSTVLMHKQPDDIWRVDYQLRDDEDPQEAVKPENVLPRVRAHLAWIGERDDWEPVWISSYKANCLTLDKYKHGRVLFAGDAAHLVPIFGVRGLNSGIEDADNLAWKLAYVAQGRAGEALLDSYSDERVFAARENIRYASKSTEFMAPPSHGFKLMRRAVLSLVAKHVFFTSLVNPRQSSAIAYLDSPLNGHDGGADRGFVTGPRPGEVLPECPVTQSAGKPGHLTDLLGPGFTLLCFGVLPKGIEAVCAALSGRGVQLSPWLLTRAAPGKGVAAVAHDHTGALFALFGATDGVAYLVRPDGVVAACWPQACVAGVSAAVERVLCV